MINQIHQHNVLQTPWPLADESVDMILTSPPYWGLRDYGTGWWEGGSPDCHHDNGGLTCAKCGAAYIDEQLGMEPTPEAFVANLVKVFREAWRVLRPWGTLWLNLGDTYYAGKGRNGASWTTKHGGNKNAKGCNYWKLGTTRPQDAPQLGLKKKDLVGIPWRVAFALQADGWYLRQDIIWHKPNVMPENVTDRCTKAHEYLFLLSKAPHYYYDAEAIKELASQNSHRRKPKDGSRNSNPSGKTSATGSGIKNNASFAAAIGDLVTLRNKRSVWSIPTAGFSGAHFATFPEELCTAAILAGTSPYHCNVCGAPHERLTDPVVVIGTTGATDSAYPMGSSAGRLAKKRQAAREKGMEYISERKTVGWKPTCCCGTKIAVPGVVLDPFMGAGTTALQALAHSRRFMGIELKPANIDMAEARLLAEFNMFYKASK